MNELQFSAFCFVFADQLADKRLSFLNRVEAARELGLEAFVEEWAELGARREAELDEVATLDDGARCLVSNLKRLGS